MLFQNPVTLVGIAGYAITTIGCIMYSESKKRGKRSVGNKIRTYPEVAGESELLRSKGQETYPASPERKKLSGLVASNRRARSPDQLGHIYNV
jgi:hypothetical protein